MEICLDCDIIARKTNNPNALCADCKKIKGKYLLQVNESNKCNKCTPNNWCDECLKEMSESVDEPLTLEDYEW